MFRGSPFHLVDQSPWPIMASLCAFLVAGGLIFLMHLKISSLVFLGCFFLSLVSFLWWRDVVREASYLGFHMYMVQQGLRIGMLLFIVSEVFFFFGFFWTLFHSSLVPVLEVGGVWPPYYLTVLDPLGVPLLNTVVLLCSGVTVTYSHHSVIGYNYDGAILGLVFTLGLGSFFTGLQGMEYFESSFNISDSVYGSVFFMATGFHGFHVIVGSIFLGVNLFRMMSGQTAGFQHVGYECAIWYWHFVDVVWIFLYVSLYWWGSL
uniref:Cytochrome c oxidase subunit 3 n=1 Tax=Botrylloides leachii TaxID=62808 RepID=A0A024HWD4_BOTLH|nr:cytochrome c oxidase subunit III [Botrylloides leachii]CCO25713.1 cytochrome c oxidase subunit III [Botrylloides leachii]CDM98941.1 cytochrome c oxidase subunit III [Botrylloides leachii]